MRAVPSYDLFDGPRACQLRLISRRVASDEFVLEVRRNFVLEDSRAIFEDSNELLSCTHLRVRFHGETGIDFGGMSAEFFRMLALEMRVLFKETSSYELIFDSSNCSESLANMCGKLLALAVVHCKLVSELPFIMPYYKFLLGEDIGLADLEEVDSEHFKSLTWMLNNDGNQKAKSYEKKF
jgi:E3 ubiquitin-protein ligase NEDD4